VYLAPTAVQGYDAQDRARLIELARASGLPVVVQGMGYRPGQKEMWDKQTAFLADARAEGAAIFSMLRTQPFMRPFNWNRGTSLFDGVFHWRDIQAMAPDARLAAMKDSSKRAELRWGLDNPNKDPEKGSTLPPPALAALFVDRSGANPAAEGKSLAQLAKERGVHAADIMCELAVADGGATQFLWNSESAPWIEANAESQKNPHMIIGTGDGGAHADRDDGAEWSTYFLKSWLLDREVFPIEEGVRRITHHPAMVCGIPLRGLLARGYHADVVMFDPTRLKLGKKHLASDLPSGEERWQVKPEGVVRVMVNGEVIIENNELTGARPGRVLRIGNRA
jgi:N-acyl-D-amino-acid deacylase